jgi:hypothetical protein
MLELVLTVCAMTQPNTCRNERLLFESDASLMQCTMNAPPFIAQWGDKHPEWLVRRWKCQYPGKGDKDI